MQGGRSVRPAGRRLVMVSAAAVAAVLVGCGGDDAPASPASSGPSSSDPSSVAPDDVTPSGFDQVAVQVIDAGGAAQTFCAWYAGDGDRRARGLMDVTSLGECPAMVFAYPDPVTNQFWMRNTLLDLTVSFWDVDGAYVSSADMVPCPPEVVDCPRYSADGPYVLAVEVRLGDSTTLGLVEGSRLRLVEPGD